MMQTLSIAAGLLLAALAIGCLLLERRPGYGAYYGLAKLTGAKLDIGPVDFAALSRRASRNDALACPPGCCPSAKPDWEAKAYDMSPAELLERVTKAALAEPNTGRLSGADRDRTGRFVQHSRVMRFPDTIDVEVFPMGENKSTLAIYSRSLLGRRDFGVNRARVARWLAALDKSP
jgi:uncharacterized protein (DUF1499 family)